MGGWISLWFSAYVTKIICIVMALYLSLNTLMNLVSKSKKEKYIMTPLSFISAICFVFDRINMIKEGNNPYFVKKLETGYVVIGDNQHFKGYSLFLCKQHKNEVGKFYGN